MSAHNLPAQFSDAIWKLLPDPGSGKSLYNSSTGHIALVIGTTAETNTLPDPTKVGLRLLVTAYSVGAGGSRAITAASKIGESGQTSFTLSSIDHYVLLESIAASANSPNRARWQIIDSDNLNVEAVTMEWVATSVDKVSFTATRPYRVKAITSRVEVAGTDAGAVTAIIKKAPSATAITAGTPLHSGTINLKGAAATNQALTLSVTDADLNIATGDSIGIDFTGVLTTAAGVATVTLAGQ